MFSYPMRRGGAPQGGPRDRGGSQVPLGGVHHNLVGAREGGGADTSWKEESGERECGRRERERGGERGRGRGRGRGSGSKRERVAQGEGERRREE